MIEQERRGEQIDRSLLRSLVNMLSSVALYDEFEKELFRETEAIYKQEGYFLICVNIYLQQLYLKLINYRAHKTLQFRAPSQEKFLYT